MYRILVSSCLAYEDFLLKKYIAIKYSSFASSGVKEVKGVIAPYGR